MHSIVLLLILPLVSAAVVTSKCVTQIENRFHLNSTFNRCVQKQLNTVDSGQCVELITLIEAQLDQLKLWPQWKASDAEARRNILSSLFSLLHYKAQLSSSRDELPTFLFKDKCFASDIWPNQHELICAEHFRSALQVNSPFVAELSAWFASLEDSACNQFTDYFKVNALKFSKLTEEQWNELADLERHTLVRSVFPLLYYRSKESAQENQVDSKELDQTAPGSLFHDRAFLSDIFLPTLLQLDSEVANASLPSTATSKPRGDNTLKILFLVIPLILCAIFVYICLRIFDIVPPLL